MRRNREVRVMIIVIRSIGLINLMELKQRLDYQWYPKQSTHYLRDPYWEEGTTDCSHVRNKLKLLKLYYLFF